MIAYSGLVNDDVRKQAKAAGFKVVIESPLTVQKIQAHILANLEQRISAKKEMLLDQPQLKYGQIEIIDEASEQESEEEMSITESSMGLFDRINQLNGFNNWSSFF